MLPPLLLKLKRAAIGRWVNPRRHSDISRSRCVQHEQRRRFAWHRKHREVMRVQSLDGPAERTGLVGKSGKGAWHVSACEHKSPLRHLQVFAGNIQLLSEGRKRVRDAQLLE